MFKNGPKSLRRAASTNPLPDQQSTRHIKEDNTIYMQEETAEVRGNSPQAKVEVSEGDSSESVGLSSDFERMSLSASDIALQPFNPTSEITWTSLKTTDTSANQSSMASISTDDRSMSDKSTSTTPSVHSSIETDDSSVVAGENIVVSDFIPNSYTTEWIVSGNARPDSPYLSSKNGNRLPKTTQPASTVKQLPSLTKQQLACRRVVPTDLIRNAEHLEEFRDTTSSDDLDHIETLGIVLSGAMLHEDAFRLFRLLMTQVTHSKAHANQLFPLVLQGALNLTKSATKEEEYNLVSGMLKAWTPKALNFRSNHSIKGCFLQSYLGRCFQAQHDLKLAEKYCRMALCNYQSMDPDLRRPGYQAVIVENLIQVIEECKGYNFQQESAGFRGLQLPNPDETLTRIINVALKTIFTWCGARIEDNHFGEMVRAIDGSLWIDASNSEQQADFERTLVFCYLHKRLQDDQLRDAIAGSPGRSQAAFLDLSRCSGIIPLEALPAISRMITHTRSLYYSQASLIRRVAIDTTLIIQHRHLRNLDAFINSYLEPLRRKKMSPEPSEYTSTLQKFVRNFLDENFRLCLSEGAFQDPRIRSIPGSGPFGPSNTATLAPTPRSSWSGLRSTSSFSERISAIMRPSLRWSQNSFALSMATSGSSRPSIRLSRRRSSMDTGEDTQTEAATAIGIAISSPIPQSNLDTMHWSREYSGPIREHEEPIFTTDDPMEF